MTRVSRLSLIKLLCLTGFCWAGASWAFTLGSPQVQSLAGEPLRVEIPISITADDQVLLQSLTVDMPNRSAYEQLGVSERIIQFNPQAMIYRNRQDDLMVLIETVNPVSIAEEPFINVLLNLSWASGSQLKTFTFLLADPQKILVKPGQTLSGIAASMLPEFDGATLDQTMIALFKANPDAFASGNINVLSAGAELKKQWRALFDTEPPLFNRRYIETRLGYRIQELTYGGLKPETVRRLQELGEQLDGGNIATRRIRTDLKPIIGTRLIREWQGTEHCVTVTRDGFEWQGRPYKSLSAIAHAITGTRWNGPRFFGLRNSTEAT